MTTQFRLINIIIIIIMERNGASHEKLQNLLVITYVPTAVTQAPQQFAPQQSHHRLEATYSSPAAQAEELVTPQVAKALHGRRQTTGTMSWAVVA